MRSCSEKVQCSAQMAFNGLNKCPCMLPPQAQLSYALLPCGHAGAYILRKITCRRCGFEPLSEMGCQIYCVRRPDKACSDVARQHVLKVLMTKHNLLLFCSASHQGCRQYKLVLHASLATKTPNECMTWRQATVLLGHSCGCNVGM